MVHISCGFDKGDPRLYTKGKKRNLLSNIKSIDVRKSMILFEPEMVMIKHPKALYLINPAGGIKKIMQPGVDYTNYSLIRDRTNGLYVLFDDGRPVLRMTQSFKIVKQQLY